MQNIFVEFLPPWIETGLQPAFYDKESGTVLQQVARMYAKVNYLIKMFNDFSKDTTDFVNDFVDSTNTEINRFETEVDTRVTNFEQSTTETVNDYIARFVALKDFVDDYFDNLDVQEEINNKLDDMAEAGTLQEIITQYINTTALWMFDNVAGMKLATNFTDGSYAKTLGYYTRNDKGGATYKIRTKTQADTANEMTLIALNDTTLIAELVLNPCMNVKQFGAKGDGITNDTSNIQCALDQVKNVRIPAGTYMVDAVTQIALNDDNHLTIDNDGIIKALPNSASNYAVLLIDDVDNVVVTGGTVQGDRNEHTGTSGEWGHCIAVKNGATNITLDNIRLIDGWGDGVYINNVTDIVTRDLIIDNCRRNGISVISATNYLSDNDNIKNINGTEPQFGIDIEPNENTDVLKNVVFRNLHTYNCAEGGFVSSLQNLDATSQPIAVKIINYTDDTSPVGIKLIKSELATGEFDIIDATLKNNQNNALQFRNWQYNAQFYTRVKGLNIYRTSVASNATSNSAVFMLGTTTSGNIILENLNIEQTGVGSNCYDVYLNTPNNNVSIINTIHKTNEYNVGSSTGNFHLEDANEVFKLVTGTASGTIGASTLRSMSVRDSDSPTDFTVNFSSNTPTGYKCLFVNNNKGTGKYQIQFPDDTYCRQFSTSAAPLLKLSSGASIEIERLSATDFIVRAASGTITV